MRGDALQFDRGEEIIGDDDSRTCEINHHDSIADDAAPIVCSFHVPSRLPGSSGRVLDQAV